METKSNNSKKYILIIAIIAAICVVGIVVAFHMGQSSAQTATAETSTENADGIKIADDASEWDKSLDDASEQETRVKS